MSGFLWACEGEGLGLGRGGTNSTSGRAVRIDVPSHHWITVSWSPVLEAVPQLSKSGSGAVRLSEPALAKMKSEAIQVVPVGVHNDLACFGVYPPKDRTGGMCELRGVGFECIHDTRMLQCVDAHAACM